MRCWIVFATLVVLLAHTSFAADLLPSDIIAFAAPKPGDKIAVLLPDKRDLTSVLCKATGDAGHVYAITAPLSSTATDAHAKLAEESSAVACTNVTALTLQPRNFPAPELYNSSDDPGVVYAYVTQRLPIESFAAPELLDVIWVSLNYSDLRGAKFGLPNMSWVNSAFLKALKLGGVLIVEDGAAAASRMKQEVIAAGFEFIAEAKASDREDDSQVKKNYKTHRTDRFLLKFRKPAED